MVQAAIEVVALAVTDQGAVWVVVHAEAVVSMVAAGRARGTVRCACVVLHHTATLAQQPAHSVDHGVPAGWAGVMAVTATTEATAAGAAPAMVTMGAQVVAAAALVAMVGERMLVLVGLAAATAVQVVMEVVVQRPIRRRYGWLCPRQVGPAGCTGAADVQWHLHSLLAAGMAAMRISMVGSAKQEGGWNMGSRLGGAEVAGSRLQLHTRNILWHSERSFQWVLWSGASMCLVRTVRQALPA